jgi:DNA-binding NarL/FixJ family response regulator
MKISILIVEDHTSFFEYYEQVLKALCTEQVDLHHAKTQAEAIDYLNRHFDLVIVDIILESMGSQNVYSGKDIALRIRNNHPKTKILLASTITHSHLIHDLMIAIKPDGFIIKSDFDHAECTLALQTVLAGEQYFSERVRRYQKSLSVFDKKTSLSIEDYQVLLLMSHNYSTNMIAQFIKKSPRSVEYIKTRIKDILGLTHNSEVVPTAFNLGII